MIDEKFLERVAVADIWEGCERTWMLGDFTEEEASEVLQLARLGLWAREHAIPVLRWYNDKGQPEDEGTPGAIYHQAKLYWHADKALAALPKCVPDDTL